MTSIACADTARRLLTAIITPTLMASAGAARACDLCSTPSAPDAGPGFSVGVFEQYSHFGTLRDNGEKVDNAVGQHLDSSVTQLVVGHRIDQRYSMQVIVPYIHRDFRRPEGFEIDQGTEHGLGDISVLGYVRAIRIDEGDSILRVDDFIGLELPTGRSGRLGEEAQEVAVPGAHESGVHGHDLALGSGSWDIPLGVDAFARWRRTYVGIRAQYTIRNRGAHGYQYANDFTWSITPGFDAWRDGPSRLGLETCLSGEAKGKDVSHGESLATRGSWRPIWAPRSPRRGSAECSESPGSICRCSSTTPRCNSCRITAYAAA